MRNVISQALGFCAVAALMSASAAFADDREVLADFVYCLENVTSVDQGAALLEGRGYSQIDAEAFPQLSNIVSSQERKRSLISPDFQDNPEFTVFSKTVDDHDVFMLLISATNEGSRSIGCEAYDFSDVAVRNDDAYVMSLGESLGRPRDDELFNSGRFLVAYWFRAGVQDGADTNVRAYLIDKDPRVGLYFGFGGRAYQGVVIRKDEA